MTSSNQLTMFEPVGNDLARLVAVHSKNAQHERRIAENLLCGGFITAAQSRTIYANDCDLSAATCEMALQFESLAGLV